MGAEWDMNNPLLALHIIRIFDLINPIREEEKIPQRTWSGQAPTLYKHQIRWAIAMLHRRQGRWADPVESYFTYGEAQLAM